MLLIGIDEAGRGAWAGPLVAAAVLVDDSTNYDWSMINDSKKLTRKQREKALEIIQKTAPQIGIGWVQAYAIDEIGLTEANRLAMERARKQLFIDNAELLIDGNIKYLENSKAIVGGDGTVPCISAASIIAKVMRDRFMCIMAQKYTGYGFEKHVGYGTAVHAQALKLQGLTRIHRRSFAPIKAFLP